MISDSERQSFCDYFYRQTGMSFIDNKPYYVDKRLEAPAVRNCSS